ncbi:Maf family protein [Virgibacillus ndiopensis]|uniref:Maf family protein n=1 Tax=Virgibacillus ndiopensis TaxID=2004408 RepID=UPI000C06CC8F|nr:Maf family protein [Virgibacillus ndiopensis]
MSRQLVLASSSPRRQELLKQINIPFIVRKQDVDESLIQTDSPLEKVKELALLKGRNAEIMNDDEVIIAADTVVSYENQIFEKPKNKQDAFNMLSTLNGNVHEVYTGVMIRTNNDERVFIEKTLVEFWALSHDEIESYISTQDPFDKAGAYGIQTKGAILVKKITGDYYNVVGLPISRVVRELRNFLV